jgi:flagellar basal body-associated protein FliL
MFGKESEASGARMKKFSVLALTAAIVFATLAVVATPAKAATESVEFDLDYTYSGVTLTASYEPDITINAASVAPGGAEVETDVTLAGDTMTLGIDISGVGDASISVNPLGEHSYDIPGLTYNYYFVALSLRLVIDGRVTGTLSSSGDGTATPSGAMMWTSAGAKTVTVTSDDDSVNRDSIELRLGNLRYEVFASVVAYGYVTYYGDVEYSILSDVQMGNILGSPAEVEETISVETPAPEGMGIWPWLIIIIIIVVVVIVVAVVVMKKRGKPARPQQWQGGHPQQQYQQPGQQQHGAHQQTQPSHQHYHQPQQQYAQQPQPQPYVAPVPAVAHQPQAAQVYNCTQCGGQLTYVQQYQRWFCPRCNRYL